MQSIIIVRIFLEKVRTAHSDILHTSEKLNGVIKKLWLFVIGRGAPNSGRRSARSTAGGLRSARSEKNLVASSVTFDSLFQMVQQSSTAPEGSSSARFSHDAPSSGSSGGAALGPPAQRVRIEFPVAPPARSLAPQPPASASLTAGSGALGAGGAHTVTTRGVTFEELSSDIRRPTTGGGRSGTGTGTGARTPSTSSSSFTASASSRKAARLARAGKPGVDSSAEKGTARDRDADAEDSGGASANAAGDRPRVHVPQSAALPAALAAALKAAAAAQPVAPDLLPASSSRSSDAKPVAADKAATSHKKPMCVSIANHK